MEKFKRSVQLFSDIKLSQQEIINRIPMDVMKSIKQKNEHPYFRAYSIAHEGTFAPKVIGEGYKKITWTRAAIQSLKNVVMKGIKFFKGHNKDNSTNNRNDFGEVVSNFEEEIDNEIHHIVIGYFPDKASVVDDDIVSMEADWTFLDNAGQWIAEKIESITGIALGDSNYEQPAFTGARVLGAVQANEQETKMEITFQDVQKFVQDHNVWAWQLFSIEQIKSDREFGKHFIDFEKNEKKYKEDLLALETKSKNYEDKLKLIQIDYDKRTAKDRLETHLKTNNIILTEKEKIFVDSSFKALSDYSDDSLKKFVDTSRETYKDMASKDLFGDREKPVTIQQKNITGDKDYTKPENNEAILPD